jgi:hypothetical protein
MKSIDGVATPTLFAAALSTTSLILWRATKGNFQELHLLWNILTWFVSIGALVIYIIIWKVSDFFLSDEDLEIG